MKHFKLLLASFALFGAMNANAQTDVTSQYIQNADFSSTDGWTAYVSEQFKDFGNGLIGTYGVRTAEGQGVSTVDETHLATEYCLGLECRWSTNYASYNQTTGELPAGVYTLTYDVENTNPQTTSSNNYNNLFYVQVGEQKTTDSSTEWMKGKSSWTTHTINFTVDEPTTAIISLGYGTGSNNYGSKNTPTIHVSHLKLTYQSLLDGVKALWQEAYDAAVAAKDNADYASITGEERTVLEAEIAKAEPTTKEDYEAATTALKDATSAFTAAKAAYDAFEAAKTSTIIPDLAYASAEKKSAIENAVAAEAPTSAADATEKAAAITTALRAYYESHAMAEGVDGAVDMTAKVSDANADVNQGWTKGVGTNRGQGYTDAAGNVAPTYLDGGWASNAGANIDMTREVAVPAGKYLLTVTARGAVGLDEYTLSIADQTINLPHNGGAGGVFNNGWDDASVEFESDGSPLTLEIIAKSAAAQQWMSINRFRLVRLELYTEMADAADYAALNDAITAAEAKTLGFDEGEYAPYNNVEALQAIADAKAINQESENSKEEVNALTAKLNDSWVANTEEVNAVYDGTLANAPIQATSENVVLPGWVTKSGNTRQTFSGTDNENGGKAALADADAQVGLFVHPGTYNYGETVGYTMPLKGGVTYLAQAKYCAWANNSNNNFTLTILKDGATVASQNYGKNGVACTEAGALKNVKLYFTPEQDGDYVLSVIANGNTFMTDFYIMRANVEDVVLEDAATEAPTAEFGNVTYARKLVEGYNTLVLPFDVTKDELGENVEAIYAYGGSTLEGDVCHLDFSQKVTSLAANTPYIVKMAALQEGLSFTNKEFKTVAEPIKTDANFDFVGTYVALPAGNETIVEGDYVSAASGLKPATAGKKLNAFRAFLKKKAEAPAGAKVAIMIGDEVVDGIQAAQIINNVDGTIYNLNGQKVINAQKGIFIQNGKKVVIK